MEDAPKMLSPQGAGSTALQIRQGPDLSAFVVPPASAVAPPEEEAIHFRDLWRIVVKRKWTMILCFLVVVVATMIATFMMTPVFRPVITLKIERDAPKVIEFKDVTPVESQGDRDFYQTQYELLKSRTLVERVIEQLSLGRNSLLKTTVEKPWWSGLLNDRVDDAGQSAATKSNPNESAINGLLGALTVEPVRNSRLVKIYFESPDRRLAADVLNALAQNFINVNLERRYDASAYAKTFLEEKLAQTKAKLEDSERTLVGFQRGQQIINVDERQNIQAQTLNEFNLAATQLERERTKAEAQFNEFNASPTSSPQVLENKAIQTLKEERAKLQAEYQDQSRLYKPAFPKMQQLTASIAELDRMIIEETEAIRRSAEGSYKALVKQEASILARLETSKKHVLDLQDRSIKFNILKREVDTNRQLYEGLLQRLKEVSVAGGVGINNITVVDPAEAPSSPYKPRLRRNVLIAAMLGLLVGVVIVFFLEYLDDTLRMPDEMERLTRLAVLGIVPRVKPQKGGERAPLAMTAHTDMRSAFAESYRSVRTALQFSTREGAPRQLVVTSTSSAEGKTTTAVSLAINLAQTGQVVVLVDADLRNPSLHKQLNVDNSRGLSNFLSSEMPPLAVVHTTSVRNLFVITSGPYPPNPVELLSGPKMMLLLAQLGRRFSHVIVDAPPVMGIADAIVLGNQVGAVLFVVSAGTTRKVHARAALKRLRQSGVEPIGVVMTKVNLRDGMYGYESAYYYYTSANDTLRLPKA
jgi:polysaccharide biosynthesis transport protein